MAVKYVIQSITTDGANFLFNGVSLPKVYGLDPISLFSKNPTVVNQNNPDSDRLFSCLLNDVSVDGIVYNTIEDLSTALNPVIYGITYSATIIPAVTIYINEKLKERVLVASGVSFSTDYISSSELTLLESVSLFMKPHSRKTGLVFSIKPTDGTGDFTFAGSAVDEINSAGVSTTVNANEPRFDFQGEYVAPSDNSYYSFDGIENKIVSTRIIYGTDSYALIEFETSDITKFQRLFCDISASTELGNFGISQSNGNLSVIYSNGGYHWMGVTSVISNNIKYIIEVWQVGTVIHLAIDGVEQVLSSVSFTSAGLNETIIGIRDSSSLTNALLGKIYRFYRFNNVPTADMSNVRNGIIGPKYIGANNVSVTAGNFTIGINYRIDTIGTTDFTLIGASANTVGLEFKATAVGVGTGTATTAGNTLLLDGGKTSAIWYDKTHPLSGAVTGATLTNPNGFTTNIHPILTCPKVRFEPSAINLFQDNSNPATQTIPTVIGTKYTCSIKGTGLLTLDETGGNGRGGVVTEVDSFTYIATATSMVVTVVTAPTNVNFTDTSVPIRNIPTLPASTANKVKDQITQQTLAFATNNFEIFLEQEIFNPTESAVTFLFKNATQNIGINNNIFDVNPGTAYTLPTGKNKIIAQNNDTNFVLYVNGALVLTETRLTTVLNILDLTAGNTAVQEYTKVYYKDSSNLSTSTELINATT